MSRNLSSIYDLYREENRHVDDESDNIRFEYKYKTEIANWIISLRRFKVDSVIDKVKNIFITIAQNATSNIVLYDKLRIDFL
jgi:hypothetical protein